LLQVRAKAVGVRVLAKKLHAGKWVTGGGSHQRMGYGMVGVTRPSDHQYPLCTPHAHQSQTIVVHRPSVCR
jgi:hypothetical protein